MPGWMAKPADESNPMTDTLYGVFGGTFDPIHHGHIETVRQATAKCALHSTRFVPCANPPHRLVPCANAYARLEMVSLAIAEIPEFILDEREYLSTYGHQSRPTQPCYTYDTLARLKHELPDKTPCFILGVDALLEMECWHRWQDLFAMTHFIVLQRPGWAAPAVLPRWWQRARTRSLDELKSTPAGKILELEIVQNPLSATEIRRRIAHGADVSGMLNHRVWRYIRRHNLYGINRDS